MYLKNINEDLKWKNVYPWNMDIILGTSNWDICFDANLKLSKILAQKDVPHWLDIRQDREHDWPVWKEMFPHYLSRIKYSSDCLSSIKPKRRS